MSDQFKGSGAAVVSPPAPPLAPLPLARSIRIIESPTVHAKYANGEMKGQPKPPFSGTRLGQRFLDGLAEVDEEATWDCVNPDTHGPKADRVWHLLVQDYGMRDITPADQPPRYPLPPMKPARARTEGQTDADVIRYPIGPRRGGPAPLTTD